AQVKISGFRIEIGEIENTLLRAPGVREGAVVVAERADRSKHLVAFYSSERPLDAGELRERLGESLPAYMVPATFHWRDSLPLTDNGKTNRKALTALAVELDAVEPTRERPGTATEDWLAAAWAEVLGIPKNQIGRQDHFFDLGGTSLSALKLVIALDRAVSFKELRTHPILAAQAALLDARVEPGVRAAPLPVPGGRCAATGTTAARRDGSVRAAAMLRSGGLLVVDVAAQPAHVHAPRAQLRAPGPQPHAVRVPRGADGRRRDAGGRCLDRARRPAGRIGRAL